MASREALIAGLRKADKLYKETGEERHREAARRFAAALRNPEAEKPTESRDQRLERERAETADGITFRPFGMDTGVEMPQPMTEFLAGAGRRLSEIGTLGRHEADPRAAEMLDDSGYATAGGVAADMAAMAVPGTAAAKGAGALAKAAQAVGRPQTVAQAAAGGAAYSAATTPGDFKDRASAAAAGALGAGAGQGVAKAVGRAVHPKLQPGAKELMDEGVTLTPGQALGGMTKRVEDAITSVPGVGDAARGAQGRSLGQFNKKVINDALSGIGESVDPRIKPGRDSIQVAQDKVSEGFSRLLRDLPMRKDNAFKLDVNLARSDLQPKVPKSALRQFDTAVSNLEEAFSNGMATGENFQLADTALREAYEGLMSATKNIQKQTVGRSLRRVHTALLDMVERQHPDKIDELRALKQSYAKLSVIEDAAGYEGAKEGVFTPSHLWRAMKSRTDRKAVAGGRGFDQQSWEQGKEIFGQSVPDSGTPLRSMIALGGAGMIDPTAAGGVALGMGAYTSPAQRAIGTMLTAGRGAGTQAVREGIDQWAPVAANAGEAMMINDR